MIKNILEVIFYIILCALFIIFAPIIYVAIISFIGLWMIGMLCCMIVLLPIIYYQTYELKKSNKEKIEKFYEESEEQND